MYVCVCVNNLKTSHLELLVPQENLQLLFNQLLLCKKAGTCFILKVVVVVKVLRLEVGIVSLVGLQHSVVLP